MHKEKTKRRDTNVSLVNVKLYLLKWSLEPIRFFIYVPGRFWKVFPSGWEVRTAIPLPAQKIFNVTFFLFEMRSTLKQCQ